MMSFITITRCWSDKLKAISLWYYNIKSKFATGRRLYIKYIICKSNAKIKNFRTNCSFPAVPYRFHVYVKIRDFFFSFSKSIDESTHIILTAFSRLNDRHVCLENYIDWQPYNGGSFFAWYSALYDSSCHVLGKSNNNVSAIILYTIGMCVEIFSRRNPAHGR